MDVARVKERTRTAWGAGDYAELSRVLEPASHALCAACAVSAGERVLDVAAGDGNFALAAARAGAEVVACDLSPVMVARGRARAQVAGQAIDWLEGDAEALPLPDARFDCVGSVFGAMIAPRPSLVAGELFRVVRPGGRVGMVAWTRDSFAVEMFAVVRRRVPMPPDMPRGEEWGDEDVVRERFGGLAASVAFERRSLPFEADSPEVLIDASFRTPAWAAAAKQLPAAEVAAMRAELLELIRAHGGAGRVRIEADYLVAVARRRG